MHILVTNDDGVTAPGLLALAQEMRQFGTVSIVAPDHDWSGGGHVKTLNRPLRVRRVKLADGSEALTSDGAPSDCVALALMGLLKDKVDLVVSGVNTAANLGHDVTYSGTVTAVMEGIIWGVPGVAVSLDGRSRNSLELDYTLAINTVISNTGRRWCAPFCKMSCPKAPSSTLTCPNCPSTSSMALSSPGKGCAFTATAWINEQTHAAMIIIGLAATGQRVCRMKAPMWGQFLPGTLP